MPRLRLRVRLRLMMLGIVLVAVILAWLATLARVTNREPRIESNRWWLAHSYEPNRAMLEAKFRTAEALGEHIEATRLQAELKQWESARDLILKEVEDDASVPYWQKMFEGLRWFFGRFR